MTTEEHVNLVLSVSANQALARIVKEEQEATVQKVENLVKGFRAGKMTYDEFLEGLYMGETS
jgi:hypothetical protein